MAFCAAADRVQRGAIAANRAIPSRERGVHVADGCTNTWTFIAVAAGQSLDKPAKCGDEVRFGLARSSRCPGDLANVLLWRIRFAAIVVLLTRHGRRNQEHARDRHEESH